MYIEVARSFSLIGHGVHVPEKIKAHAFFFWMSSFVRCLFVSCHVRRGGMLIFHFDSRLLFIAIFSPLFVVGFLFYLNGHWKFVHIWKAFKPVRTGTCGAAIDSIIFHTGQIGVYKAKTPDLINGYRLDAQQLFSCMEHTHTRLWTSLGQVNMYHLFLSYIFKATALFVECPGKEQKNRLFYFFLHYSGCCYC